ncbi:MAG: Na+:solute symporter [Edaphobacter sp.]|uniref:sodium:solute symporter family protein n=1 Tax=Edaphobacter sp. TaxID=1934404 RepID=UPI0023A46BAC|nr:sodium:solute symporter family protein [Edaphobacter sp.]MDE1177919.1 Na+:solute symporter [Edaphobacter sp.]
MSQLSWLVLSCYFVLMLAVGLWVRSRVKDAKDFFTAGGKMPWWLAGISHHMSGYSSAAFVGYAAIAYSDGISLYLWWACSIAIALLIGSFVFPGQWVRLRLYTGMISPLEYLKARYSVGVQQVLAISGTLLKVFDVGAKWTASALLLNFYAGVPIFWGVLLTGGVTLVYSVVGGLWADAVTDLSQFLIQLVSGLLIFVAVVARLGGVHSLWTVWKQLPASHHMPFHGKYTLTFMLVYTIINLLSYNGGTWSLAQRFLASPDEQSAIRSSRLSAALYVVWPLVLFFPMWVAPVLLPHLVDPSQSYARLSQELLPHGLIGLVLAGLIAHSMAMTSSDANAIAAVVIRDIVPVFFPHSSAAQEQGQLFAARVFTFCFLLASMIVALLAPHMGGVLGLILLWYAALVGPIAVPMLFGMLPALRRCGSRAALLSYVSGLIAFVATKVFLSPQMQESANGFVLAVGGPTLVSVFVFLISGLIAPQQTPQSMELFRSIQHSSSSAMMKEAGISLSKG